MEPYQQIIAGVFGLIVIIVAIKLFSAPLKWAMKALLNTVLGFVALIVFNVVGGFAGITLTVNLINALVIGVLGLPGFALLLFVKWLLGM